MHARGEPYNRNAQSLLCTPPNRGIDIARVARQQGAKHDDDLARTMARRALQHSAAHLERVLQAWVAAALAGHEGAHGGEVQVRVAGEVGDGLGEAVAHADEGELRDGVLLEELADVGERVAQRE